MNEKAREKINGLVERFRENLDVYKKGLYNETQLRREFIDPFFEALGWDVQNKQGFAEQYKEVVHEDSIKVGVSLKAPDYSFRIGGQRKFFLETKKPAVNIKEDVAPAYQLRRYAWSAKLPLSILTDFEEFSVYDCRIKPKPTDKVTTGRVAYYTYEQYIEKFGEIYDRFSKEAVLKGSFDRYIETTRGMRGTAEVDKEFLREIESWRDCLARNLALRNPGLTVGELNFAVQQTLDRIIFLRICEDRGIENYGQLQALSNGANTYRRLFELFCRADEKYNSGLFDFKADSLSHTLDIDDKTLKTIIENLYHPESPYEFSVINAEILGNVYEQFLGKVIRLTAGHAAKVEEKPEVKKAGGVYYTPDYIVKYIVENTVGKLLGDISGDSKSPSPLEGEAHIFTPSPLEGEGGGGGLNSYNPRLIQLARNLRKNQTDAEKLMWLLIRNKQLGVKFRRQQPIGGYIADFYCSEKKLVIELDGGKHTESKDRPKTEFLNQTGIAVLRFWNNEVLENTEGVLQAIWDKINTPHPTRPLGGCPALPQGERKTGLRTGFKMTPKQVEKIKILDPACGSGSFLIGAYHYLLDWHTRWYNENNPKKYAVGKKPAVYRSRGGWVLTTTEKKRLLLNNIFGVDIDRQAVEVTKLSLLLKVLEGENEETLGKTLALFRERALPDLKDNIKCGNSLIGPDFYDNPPPPLRERPTFLLPPPLRGRAGVGGKESWEEGDMGKINPFDWNDNEKGFGKIMKEGGFDCVIGNPPWGAKFSTSEQIFLSKRYPLVPAKTKDSYMYFLLKSISLLRKFGVIGHIIPNTWLLINNATDFRRYLLSFRIEEIIDHGDGVFEKATVESATLILSNAKDLNGKCRAIRLRKGMRVVDHELEKKIWLEDELGRIVIDMNKQSAKLLKNLYERSIPFEKKCVIIWGIKPYQVGHGIPPQTKEMIEKRIYHSSVQKGKDWKSLLVGSDVNRYEVDFPGNRFIKYGKWLMYPSNEELMKGPKILLRQTSDILRACYDEHGYYCQNSVFIIHSREINLKFLLGLLNSKLLNFVYKLGNPQTGKIFAEIKPSVIKQLPLCKINSANPRDKSLHDKMVSLVDRMLELNKKLRKVKIPHDRELLERQIKITDNQIDRLVYELYGLTEEEIKVVEGGNE